jgi:hypothetical protein
MEAVDDPTPFNLSHRKSDTSTPTWHKVLITRKPDIKWLNVP